MLYSNLMAQDTVDFWSTSFIRGTTFDNTIILVEFVMLLLFFIGGILYYLKKSPIYENYFWAIMILTYIGQNLFLSYANKHWK